MTISMLRDGHSVEGVNLSDVAARFGTPTFVYSAAAIRASVAALTDAFSLTRHKIFYSVKANSNLAVLKLCQQLGCGFDIVSGGELMRVLRAGGQADQVIFSGVGKSVEEIDLALKFGIACFNVESSGELSRISARAANLGVAAPISIRVNPNVDAQTHPYISTGLKENKFGVSPDTALTMYLEAAQDPHLKVCGIDCHIGSQINNADPLLDALYRLLELVDELGQQGVQLDHIDLGGGMGVTYQDEAPLDIAQYGARVQQAMGNRSEEIFLEPGRSIVANAGLLLTNVEYLKLAHTEDAPNFAIVNGAMNDLIRPALYQAWHDVEVINPDTNAQELTWNVVGPVCESGDFFAKQRSLRIKESDLVAIGSAGAYGMVQASNYNSRPRAAEVMIDGDTMTLIRRRESIEDLLRLETELET